MPVLENQVDKTIEDQMEDGVAQGLTMMIAKIAGLISLHQLL